MTRKRLVILSIFLFALVAPGAARAVDVDVSITSPADGAHSLTGTIPVMVQASSDVGIYSIQLQIDGQYFGVPDTTPVTPFQYEIDVDASKLTQGAHVFTAVATDWSQIGGGDRWASDDVNVDVGPAYPTISISSPAVGSFVRGTLALSATTTSALAPAETNFSIDGGPSLVSTTWDSTTVADGPHSVVGVIVDGRGKSATASSSFTVDNTPPTTSVVSPTTGTFAQGTLAAQAHGSDAFGIKSVQFLLDGSAAGSPITSGSNFTYAASLNLAGLSVGAHTVSDVATDNAGNTTMSSPVSFTIGDAPPAVSITLPPDWTFARGSVLVAANLSGGTSPDSAQLLVDNKAVGSAITAAPYQFNWNTVGTSDGTHTVAVKVTDAVGRTATSPALHLTIDNTPPSTWIITPAANGHFQTTLPVQAHASDLRGMQSLQFMIDGVLVGTPDTAPDAPGGFTYSATLPISTLAKGTHTLSARAIDAAGNQASAVGVSFIVGAAPATVNVTAPAAFTLVSNTRTVSATIAGGTAPYSAQIVVDGAASSAGTPVSGSTASLPWNTTALTDGTHSLVVAVVDADGTTTYSTPESVTVDNTPPEATMLQPTNLPGYSYARIGGDTTVQVHGSDLFGVKSVQFSVDGALYGPLITSPDAGTLYQYSETVPASAFPPGMHVLTAVVTDAAGNTTTATSVQVKGGPLVYVPVLNYHGITGPLDTNPDVYDESPAEADAELAYLKTNGYQSITIAQYRTWLTTGALPIGVTKPVLITVDDGLTDEGAWDALLQKYGFTAVMYVVTGFADNLTPGESAADHLTWTQLKALAANGRWTLAFHAGEWGHGEYDTASTTVNLGNGQVESFSPTCFWYYGCLGTITTTTTTIVNGRRTTKTTTAPETPAQAEAQITAEVSAGIAELKKQVPTADFSSWACPWNACGQWTTSYNDASNALEGWLPAYFAGQFPIVFMQTDPITYGLASGTVGALNGFNRHYRLEVHTDTTIDQFAAALTDPAFANN